MYFFHRGQSQSKARAWVIVRPGASVWARVGVADNSPPRTPQRPGCEGVRAKRQRRASLARAGRWTVAPDRHRIPPRALGQILAGPVLLSSAQGGPEAGGPAPWRGGAAEERWRRGGAQRAPPSARGAEPRHRSFLGGPRRAPLEGGQAAARAAARAADGAAAGSRPR